MKIVKEIIKYLALGFTLFILASIIEGIFGAFNLIGNSKEKVELTDIKTILTFENENINSLKIETQVAELSIKIGDYKVETNNPKVTAEIEDNKLIVKDNTKKIAQNNNTVVNIYIPEEYIFEDVEISSGVGKTTIEELIASNIDIDLGVGETVINKINAIDKIELEAGVGNLEINNALLNNLELDLGVGKTTFKGIALGKANISTGIGETNLTFIGNLNDYEFKFSKGLGEILFEDSKVKSDYSTGTGDNLVFIEGGIGKITVNLEEINED